MRSFPSDTPIHASDVKARSLGTLALDLDFDCQQAWAAALPESAMAAVAITGEITGDLAALVEVPRAVERKA